MVCEWNSCDARLYDDLAEEQSHTPRVMIKCEWVFFCFGGLSGRQSVMLCVCDINPPTRSGLAYVFIVCLALFVVKRCVSVVTPLCDVCVCVVQTQTHSRHQKLWIE